MQRSALNHRSLPLGSRSKMGPRFRLATVLRHHRRLDQSRFWPLASLLVLLCLPNLGWTQRNLQAIPDPDPEIERSSFQVADGFEVNLFAGDPQIAKPIQMNFDAQGRLWIASSEVYPHLKPGEEPHDKILVCEDTDGDGQVDRTTVFADGLLIPTGVVPGDGGCYVANSTELIHLKDTDGDGKADQRRVILSGFGTEDTHHLLHTLRWGPDGMLYMNQSIYIHSHIETPYGVRHLNGGGIWRFRPETLELDVLCEGFVNPWGHHFDRWGQSFATDGAYGEGINHVFPGAVFVTAPGATRIMSGLNPGSPKHCGLEILSGRHLPEAFRGSMVTNDFRANRVCRFVVTEDRSAYASRQEVELIKTNHVAFRPIDVKMGPDGAIYVADWYNPIIQHGEVDFRDPRRDHVHGRIWRITAKDRPVLEHPDLVNAAPAELLEQLKVPENWVRLHAKLQLKHRPLPEVLTALEAWVAELDAADQAFEHQRLEALWAYQTINVPNLPLLEECCQSADHHVRAAALRVADRWAQHLPDRGMRLFSRGVRDEHPQVRLEAVRGCATVGTRLAASEALQLLEQPMDPSLDFALWRTLRDLRDEWLPAVQRGDVDFGGDVAKLTYALRAVDAPEVVQPLLDLVRRGQVDPERQAGLLNLAASLANAEQLAEILELRFEQKDATTDLAQDLLAIARASADRRVVPARGLDRILAELGQSPTESQAAWIEVAGIWRIASAAETLGQVAKATDSDPLFLTCVAALGKIGGESGVTALVKLQGATQTLPRQTAVVGELARVDLPRSVDAAVALLDQAAPAADLSGALNPILRQQEGPGLLIPKLAEVDLDPDVARAAIRLVQAAPRPTPELIEAFRTAGKLAQAGWKLEDALVNDLVAEVNTSGDPARGELIYRRSDMQCLTCHAIGGAGGKVGPDLVSIGASAPVDYLIESLIDPNAKVKENYHSKVLQTDSGEVLTGIVVSEADGLVTLRQADDTLIRVPDEEILEMVDGRSLMPNGLVDVLTRDELVDLVAFLSRLGKVGDYSLGNRRWVRSWESLVWTEDAHRRLNRTSYDTAATDDPALTWDRGFSRVGGDLPLDGLAPFQIHAGTPPTSFVRWQLEVTTAGQVQIDWGSTTGLSVWVDGKPTPLSQPFVISLDEGRHVMTVAIDREERTEPLRVEVQDAAEQPATLQLVIDP